MIKQYDAPWYDGMQTPQVFVVLILDTVPSTLYLNSSQLVLIIRQGWQTGTIL